MSMNSTPKSERIHIALFGRRNVGKSSIINAITNQELAIVSNIKGTTTDPVYKSMEILPIGPVVLIDTPGLDDQGELGILRIKKTREVLRKTDVALLIIDARSQLTALEKELLSSLNAKKIPALIIINKADAVKSDDIRALEKEIREIKEADKCPVLSISALKREGIHELKEKLAAYITEKKEKERVIVRDLIHAGDFVILVIPIDKAAPKGRLILPQQQTIRDILDSKATAIVVQDTELAKTLAALGKKPVLVITDSQVFEKAAKETPNDILMTSFSILFARYKGELKELTAGAQAVENLKDGDMVLMSEGCTHHRQCGDIGTQKLPAWIRNYTKKSLVFETSSGNHFPDNLEKYKLIVHCGGCMLNEKEMKSRIHMARQAGVPIVNYGILIAHLKGILARSLEPFDIDKLKRAAA